MAERGNRSRFALEPVTELGLTRVFRSNQFKGDKPAEPRVARAKHHAHTPFA
jgi:hypothetical protein